jgi:hypothetical protein
LVVHSRSGIRTDVAEPKRTRLIADGATGHAFRKP